MIVMVSGGFDPVHVGHIHLFNAAADYGDVVVALNSDDWLMRKKGYVFMPHMERTVILTALEKVTIVTPVTDFDDTVCEALRRVRPDIFCNGGDRFHANKREAEVCFELSIKQVFGVGGTKTQSSSELVARVR